MGFRLFDKKHREFGIVGSFQLYSDCRDIEKVRKPVTESIEGPRELCRNRQA